MFVPLYVTLSMAFKSSAQSADGNAFSLPALAVVLTLLLSSLAAYVIARNWSHWFFRWSMIYLLVALFLPFPVVALPQIQLTALTGIDSPVASLRGRVRAWLPDGLWTDIFPTPCTRAGGPCEMHRGLAWPGLGSVSVSVPVLLLVPLVGLRPGPHWPGTGNAASSASAPPWGTPACCPRTGSGP